MLDMPYLAREMWMRLARFVYFWRRNARFVVILGAPGAGKGTISSMLSRRTGLPHLNMGNLFRREIDNKTPLGQRWGPVVKAGKLVPDKVTLALLRHELKKPEYREGAILDGFPRTLAQAQALRSLLMWWGNKVNRVVLLDVNEKDVLERVSLRRICSNKACGRSFNLKFDPPAQEGKCDGCGSPLVSRDDDKPEVISERLRIFNETFGPLMRFYDGAGLLTRVETSNEKGPEDVLIDVLFAIEQFD